MRSSPTPAILFVSIFFGAAATGLGQAPSRTLDSYLSSAKAAAGTDWAGTYLRLCIPPPPAGRAAAGGGRGTPARETWFAEPAKVADNLYFIGTKIHSAWALAGSDGIIIFEALFDYAAKDEILDGLKKVGLNPSKVKYVLLSHAHGDHDGGAKLLQDSIPGVELVYGTEDWESVDASTNHMGGKPKHQLTGDDGMRIGIGDVSVRIVTTPGHTPGTLSYLFDVRDHGKTLHVAYVGGTAIPFNGDATYYDRYLASARKMAKAAADSGANVILSNHTEFDGAFFKAHAAADRKADESNPFDVGTDGVARYFAVVEDCTTAARIRATGK
ncbi:MAG TPA: MBL fold metallo-hydrolase [Bryobacteraceae bacterium]|jgi:metallo-beta-lactamase class B